MIFAIGQMVRSPQFPELGRGQILAAREVAGAVQLTVEFPATGDIKRFAASEVVIDEDLWEKLLRGDYDEPDRFVLRFLAQALKADHLTSGGLSCARIDPLPHQILLVDKIISQNLFPHLVADDVGLGKTIEAGLLFLALRERERVERVLLVVPAGLALQWREVMEEAFGESFDVFNLDFFDTRKETWSRYSQVIASIDALKRNQPGKDGKPGRMDALSEAEPWDLVIFDEAHKLSAEHSGYGTRRTQNYQLAEMLRSRTRYMLLLTATPHQGNESRFAHLLRLLRPELHKSLPVSELPAELLNSMMTRNRKADVTDLNGNRLFKGHQVVPLEVWPSAAEQAFYQALLSYLANGYGSAEGLSDVVARAIGFVMVTFQKLAASSTAAIRSALQKRLTTLQTRAAEAAAKDQAEQDERFQGELEEQKVRFTPGHAFFEGEETLIRDLLDRAQSLPQDSKLTRLLALVEELTPDEHLLIFTEYRGTQEMLASVLQTRFGESSTVLIHGSMNLERKRESVLAFRSRARFMISTEAGGEGINLQESCHLMVNYDLPWNPMRLHQRIGRLDRYGQQERVRVYNLRIVGTIEDRVREYLEEKIERVIRAMRNLHGDAMEDLREAILGEVSQSLDVDRLYASALRNGRVQEDGEAEAGFARVQEAAEKMASLYTRLDRFNLSNLGKLHGEFARADLETLLRLYLKVHHHRLESRGPGTFSVTIPEGLRTRRGPKQLEEVTFDPAILKRHPEARLLGFGEWWFDRFLEDAVRNGGGETACWVTAAPDVGPGLIVNVAVRRRVGPEQRPQLEHVWTFCLDDDGASRKSWASSLRAEWRIGKIKGAEQVGIDREQLERWKEQIQQDLDEALRAQYSENQLPYVELEVLNLGRLLVQRVVSASDPLR